MKKIPEIIPFEKATSESLDQSIAGSGPSNYRHCPESPALDTTPLLGKPQIESGLFHEVPARHWAPETGSAPGSNPQHPHAGRGR